MKKRNFWTKLNTEYFGRGLSTLCGLIIILLTLSIIGFLFVKGVSTFTKNNYPIGKFLFSLEWNPEGSSESAAPQFGSLIFIIGSTLAAVGAVIISAPIALSLAIFMNMISPRFGSKVLQPTLELFVGIPSVVYGWVGISLLVPLIKRTFGGIGFSLLAGILVLSIMILPTIASISSDAIKTIPKEYIEGSYALGGTRWQTISKVVIPASKNGILTGIVLGIARAFGEALAVQMVIGNAIKIPGSFLDATSTLTSIITMDMANTVNGTQWNNALWSLALILLVISFIFILIIRSVGKRGKA